MSDAATRRSAVALFAGVAASGLGYTVMVAVLPLAAEDLLGSPKWSGLPSALGTAGLAAGTTWLAALTARRGRRRALVTGYAGAAAAACLAALGAALGWFVLLAAAIFLLGVGYSASRLSRYAAAELYAPSQRASAIGWNVWAATLGSVLGPLLLTRTQNGAAWLGLPEAAGPFLGAAVGFTVAAFALRLHYAPPPIAESAALPTSVTSLDGSAALLRFALVSLVVGQVVMVLIMTMTPVHMRHGGQTLGAIGAVFSAHTFGMYALSPVAGFLSDRLGRVPTILLASGILAASGLLAASSSPGSPGLAVALFLLGLGWCLSFVAASALLSESLDVSRQVRFQGFSDSLVWGSAAVAGLSSGFLVATLGYPTLSHIGTGLAVVPLFFLPFRKLGAASRHPPRGYGR